MGYYLSLPVLLLLAAAQSTLVAAIRLNNGTPDFIFLVVAAWGVHAKLEEGIVWAFVGGILHDMLSIAPLGTSVIPLLLLLFAYEALRSALYRVNVALYLVFVVLATLLQQLVFILVLPLSGYPLNIAATLRGFVAPVLLYHAALALPVYWLVRLLQRRIYARPN